MGISLFKKKTNPELHAVLEIIPRLYSRLLVEFEFQDFKENVNPITRNSGHVQLYIKQKYFKVSFNLLYNVKFLIPIQPKNILFTNQTVVYLNQ